MGDEVPISRFACGGKRTLPGTDHTDLRCGGCANLEGVSKDHVPRQVEYPPSLFVSKLMKQVKGRTSGLLQEEFPQLEKRCWGRHFWAVGYGAWRTGNSTEAMIQEYLEHRFSDIPCAPRPIPYCPEMPPPVAFL